MIFSCQICGHDAGTGHLAREMMFGLREEFHYFECKACGCTQLADVPTDMSKYYPPNYLAHESHNIRVERRGGVRGWVGERRNQAQLLGDRGLWGAIAALRPRPDVRPLPEYVSRTPGLRFRSRVLDVGCGRGKLLHQMAAVGFRDLTGVDPFLDGDTEPSPGLRLIKGTIGSLTDGPYDLIMFNHSLEHIAEQHETLAAARRLVAPAGTCVIRVPTVTSNLWAKYGVDWIELDPPRHLFVHSHASLRIAAEKAGFRVANLWCDSEGFGYWGSELYRRDLAMTDESTGKQRDPADHFGREQLDEFDRAASSDNRELRGGRLVAQLEPVR